MTGAELAAIRKAWGMTQEEFGATLGYSGKTISELEGGRKKITKSMEKHIGSINKLRKIKKLLDSP